MDYIPNMPFDVEREKAILVVVDMQNDFVRKGGALEIADARKQIPQINKLLQGCRESNIPIVFIRFIAGPKRTLIWNWSPTIAPPSKCCWKDHRRFYPDIGRQADVAAVIDELKVEETDYVVDKYGYGAFYNTPLEDILKAHKADTVVICGAAMPICINDTVAGAFERGIKVVVASDASASFTEESREYSLSLFKAKFGLVLDVNEILLKIKNG
jgi:nicotinamidase-related amidase